MSAKRRRKGRCKMQAPIKGGNFGAKLTHLCGFLLDESFFSYVKKHRSRFLLDAPFFFKCKNRRSRLWLAKTHLRMKIYDIAFSWVFLSMYKINYYIGFFVIHFPLLAILRLGAKLGRGCVPRDCLRDEFCPSVLCNLIAPNKRSYTVPDSPIVQLAIFEFQKFSLSKRGYVQTFVVLWDIFPWE